MSKPVKAAAAIGDVPPSHILLCKAEVQGLAKFFQIIWYFITFKLCGASGVFCDALDVILFINIVPLSFEICIKSVSDQHNLEGTTIEKYNIF